MLRTSSGHSSRTFESPAASYKAICVNPRAVKEKE